MKRRDESSCGSSEGGNVVKLGPEKSRRFEFEQNIVPCTSPYSCAEGD